RPGLLETGKLILLVDELSASASEVLAGALQDWDRATIVGRRTFGKGLVQEQYNLSDGSAIRLTVARYYSPLGRSIQRPYENGTKVYMDVIWERYQNGEVINEDSIRLPTDQQFKTHSGKIVYGGGGIMPDIFVPFDTSRYPTAINYLIIDGSFSNFVYEYYLKHKKEIDGYKSADDYLKNFNKRTNMWNEFTQRYASDSLNLSGITAAQRESLELRLQAFLARFRWRSSGFYQVLNTNDEMVKRALQELR